MVKSHHPKSGPNHTSLKKNTTHKHASEKGRHPQTPPNSSPQAGTIEYFETQQKKDTSTLPTVQKQIKTEQGQFKSKDTQLEHMQGLYNKAVKADEKLQPQFYTLEEQIALAEKRLTANEDTIQASASLEKGNEDEAGLLSKQIAQQKTQIEKLEKTLKEQNTKLETAQKTIQTQKNTLTRLQGQHKQSQETLQNVQTDHQNDVQQQNHVATLVQDTLGGHQQTAPHIHQALSQLDQAVTRFIANLQKQSTSLKQLKEQTAPTTDNLTWEEKSLFNVSAIQETSPEEKLSSSVPENVAKAYQSYAKEDNALTKAKEKEQDLSGDIKNQGKELKDLQEPLSQVQQIEKTSSEGVSADTRKLQDDQNKLTQTKTTLGGLKKQFGSQHDDILEEGNYHFLLKNETQQLTQEVGKNTTQLQNDAQEDKDLKKEEASVTQETEHSNQHVQTLQKTNSDLKNNLTTTEQYIAGENTRLHNALSEFTPQKTLSVAPEETKGAATNNTLENELHDTTVLKSAVVAATDEDEEESRKLHNTLTEEIQTQEQQQTTNVIHHEKEQLTGQIDTLKSYEEAPLSSHNTKVQEDLQNDTSLLKSAENDLHNVTDMTGETSHKHTVPGTSSEKPASQTLNVYQAEKGFEEAQERYAHAQFTPRHFHQKGAPDYKDVQWHHRPHTGSIQAPEHHTQAVGHSSPTIQLERDNQQLHSAIEKLPQYTQNDVIEEATHVSHEVDQLHEHGEHTAEHTKPVTHAQTDLSELGNLKDSDVRDLDYNHLKTDDLHLRPLVSEENPPSSSKATSTGNPPTHDTHPQSNTPHNSLCFCDYTQIRTPHGDVYVQDLKVGDLIVTSTGEEKPIIWIGQKAMRFKHTIIDRRNTPVCIKRHALGDDLPSDDLYVSPAHAMAFDLKTRNWFLRTQYKRVMVRAGALINNRTIFQVPMHAFNYWHTELPEHALLIANGALAESFLDRGERNYFSSKTQSPLDKYGTSGRPQEIFPRLKGGRHLRTIHKTLNKQADKLLNRKDDLFL